MSDQNIFNSNDPAPADPQEPTVTEPVVPATDPYAEALASITNDEGKQKYSNVDDALNSIPHAQRHISTLETEMAELKAELAGRKSVEELLTSKQTPAPATPAAQESVDPNAIATIVDNVLHTREVQNAAAANQKAVVDALSSKFGDKAEEIYIAKGAELGLSPTQLDQLAGTSPAAILNWFPDVAYTPQKMQSTVNAESLDAVPADPEPIKSVMGAASTKETVAAWNAIGERVKKKYEG